MSSCRRFQGFNRSCKSTHHQKSWGHCNQKNRNQSHSNALKDGYLLKLGYSSGRFQKRYFEIIMDGLRYKYAKGCRDYKDVIILNSETICQRIAPDHTLPPNALKDPKLSRGTLPPNSFLVLTDYKNSKRSYILVADSAEEVDLWISAIQRYVREGSQVLSTVVGSGTVYNQGAVIGSVAVSQKPGMRLLHMPVSMVQPPSSMYSKQLEAMDSYHNSNKNNNNNILITPNNAANEKERYFQEQQQAGLAQAFNSVTVPPPSYPGELASSATSSNNSSNKRDDFNSSNIYGGAAAAVSGVNTNDYYEIVDGPNYTLAIGEALSSSTTSTDHMYEAPPEYFEKDPN